jgi:hypothetical protein
LTWRQGGREERNKGRRKDVGKEGSERERDGKEKSLIISY